MSAVDRLLNTVNSRHGSNTSESTESEEWRLIGSQDELSKLPCRRIYCSLGKSQDVAMYFVRGKFYVINATCPHLGGRLDQINDIEDLESEPPIAVCPRHFYEYNLVTGKCEQGFTVKTYSVKIDNSGKVFILHCGLLSQQPFDTEID